MTGRFLMIFFSDPEIEKESANVTVLRVISHLVNEIDPIEIEIEIVLKKKK